MNIENITSRIKRNEEREVHNEMKHYTTLASRIKIDDKIFMPVVNVVYNDVRRILYDEIIKKWYIL
jgi:hypothetical protein